MNIAAYPKYESYKNGASERLDFPVPSHWSTDKARFLFKFNKGLTITKENLEDEGIPCVNYGEIHSKFGFAVDPAKHALKCVSLDYLKANAGSILRRGDFVFADTSEDIEGSGNFTHLDSDEVTFAGYHTVIARPESRAQPRYLAYMLDSAAFRRQVQKAVKGVKVFSISQGLLKNLEVLLPPLPEQRAIAAFLDGKSAEIDEAVRIKEAQIKLLAERRQILIQQAVTRGLNPNAPMKDSGIDWIGQIPAHWEVKPLMTEAKLKSETNRPDLELLSVYLDRGVVRFSDVDEKRTNATSLDLTNYQHVLPGDFVLNNQQAWRGSVGVSEYEGIVSPAYITLSLSDRWDSGFANLLFRSAPVVSQYLVSSKGVGTIQRNLYWPKLKRTNIAIPPIEEQRAITQYVENEREKIDAGIGTKEDQIAALVL